MVSCLDDGLEPIIGEKMFVQFGPGEGAAEPGRGEGRGGVLGTDLVWVRG